MDDNLREKLDEISCGEVVYDCPLARYTTYAIGGPADALVVVKKQNDLAALLQLLEKESVPWRVLGRGSNLLVKDVGYRGVAIILAGDFSKIDDPVVHKGKHITLQVGAGCSLTKLNRYCCRQGFGGLSFSYGIPGTVGGALLMNAGAWGHEIAELVAGVGVMTENGYEQIKAEQLDFTYRRWPGFSSYAGRAVIVDAQFSLFSSLSEHLEKKAKELLEKRKEIQPHNHPNGGSVFKNPSGDSAGRLIDECGFKGESIGGAMVSTKHANFIINRGKASSEDVLRLMARIQLEVKKRFGVELEPEIHVM
ncbi:MAG: UDP-N-acetylmuramate dehydrogenase [Desulforhopalus sp.]|jgi:UDP-N-acetylmuramate dehydrogenase